jgi:hypothetical protein
MASTDAKPVPQKNVAHRITFPIWDADGDLVTGATGLDSEISKDGGTFADCTNEATEIATSSGVYYLDVTSTEMNADTVAIIVKTSSVGAKTTTVVMYPEEAGDIRVNVTAFGGTAGTFTGGRPEVNTTHAAGTAWASGAITAASIAADAITAAKIADGAIDAATLASDTITAAKIATGAITAAKFAANALDAAALATDAVTEIQSGLATSSALTTVSGKIDVIDDFLDTEIAAIKAVTDQFVFGTANRVNAQVYGIEANAITATAIATDAIGAAELAADAVAEIQSGLSTLTAAGVRSAVGLSSANLDTQLDALPTATENADAVWVLTRTEVDGLAPAEAMRVMIAVLAGKSSGHSTNAPLYRDLADTKNRISATVTADGRTAVTVDAS